MPRLPTFPARWVLEDPRQRSYLVFWVSADGGTGYALKMAPSDQTDTVVVTFADGPTSELSAYAARCRELRVRRSSTDALGVTSRADTCIS